MSLKSSITKLVKFACVSVGFFATNANAQKKAVTQPKQDVNNQTTTPINKPHVKNRVA